LSETAASETIVTGRSAARISRRSFRIEWLLSPLVVVLVIAMWYVITENRIVSRILLPPPGAVASAMGLLLTAPWFPDHLVTTAMEMVVGFVLASAGAFAMGVVLSHIPLIRRVFYPFLVVFQVMPMVVLAPVIVIWFGFGIESKIVVAVTTAFFVVLVNTLAGMDAVHRNALLLMRSLVASNRQIFFMLELPTSLPYVFAGLKTGATLALIGALVGEFVTARAGLGRLLTQFSFALKQDLVFATVLVVGALGVLMYAAVAFLQRRIVWWKT
jgi:NitT/TauT family transport system permease protein